MDREERMKRVDDVMHAAFGAGVDGQAPDWFQARVMARVAESGAGRGFWAMFGRVARPVLATGALAAAALAWVSLTTAPGPGYMETALMGTDSLVRLVVL